MANVNLVESNDISITQSDNDISLGIKDTSLNNKIINKNEYSTTQEVVIGKWIDGKPIYRKVFTGTCDNSSEQTIEENITGIGNVVYIGGNFVRISDNLTTPIGAYLQDVPSRVMYHGGLRKILLNKSASVWNTAFNYVIIFEYTKSS
jgi:hypothetical protein